jgi:hypothetical protein
MARRPPATARSAAPARSASARSGPARPAPIRPAPAPTAADIARDRALAVQVRRVAIVLAVTMVAWMLASWAGGFYGWQARLAFLFDFLALAAFAWALIVTVRIWRARRARDRN